MKMIGHLFIRISMGEKNHRLSGFKLAICSIVLTAICYILYSVTGNLYTFTDNLTVAVVTDGMYGNNNYCQYLHPAFCAIVKLATPLFSTADIYTSLVHLLLFIGVIALWYAALQTSFRINIREWGSEGIIKRVRYLLTILYFIYGINIWETNYTVQTSAIVACGLYTLLRNSEDASDTGRIILGSLLVSSGFLLRQEGALLFLPFVALDIAAELIRSKERRVTISRLRRRLGVCLILVLGILVSKRTIESREPFSSDVQYNKYRTIAEDYPMRPWGTDDLDYSSMERSTYEAVQSWILIDTDRINSDSMKQIVEIGSKTKYAYDLTGIKSTLVRMRKQASKYDLHLLILVILTLLITGINLIFKKDIVLKAEAFLASAGGFIIIFYFTFIGRAPIRVWQCILIATACFQMLIFEKPENGTKKESDDVWGVVDNRLNHSVTEYADHINANHSNIEENHKKKAQLWTMMLAFGHLLICVLLYFGIGQVMAHAAFHSPISPLTSRVGADDSAYDPTFEDDALYIWPNWYAQIPDYFSKQNKLPTQRVIDHNIPMGDWVYGQAYFQDFLDQHDAKNPALALLDRPNTYLVEGLHEQFLEYMRIHYGGDIYLKYVGDVYENKVFRLVRESSDEKQ